MPRVHKAEGEEDLSGQASLEWAAVVMAGGPLANCHGGERGPKRRWPCRVATGRGAFSVLLKHLLSVLLFELDR